MKEMKKICPRCGVTFFAIKTSSGFRTYCDKRCANTITGKNRTHGGVGTAEYKAWEHMRGRCNNALHHAYARYGGRGIKVCPEWDYAGDGFETFLANMGPKPSPEYTLDRIDNDRGYEPGNCRWATRTEQSRNRGICIPENELQVIRDGVARGLNFRQIGDLIGRSAGSVSSKAYKMGLKSGQSPGENMTARPGLSGLGEDRK